MIKLYDEQVTTPGSVHSQDDLLSLRSKFSLRDDTEYNHPWNTPDQLRLLWEVFAHTSSAFALEWSLSFWHPHCKIYAKLGGDSSKSSTHHCTIMVSSSSLIANKITSFSLRINPLNLASLCLMLLSNWWSSEFIFFLVVQVLSFLSLVWLKNNDFITDILQWWFGTSKPSKRPYM